MLDLFIFETLQLSDQLEQLVLNSEKIDSFEGVAINEIFRIMHTIKGSAAMMVYNNISFLAHSMEELFYHLRENEDLDIDYSRLCDFILTGIDFIKIEIMKIENGVEADGDPEVLISEINEYLQTLKEEKPVSNSTDDQTFLNLQTKDYPLTSAETTGNRYAVHIVFQEGCEMENIRAFNIIHKLEEVASGIDHQPADIINDNDCSATIRQEGFLISFTSYCMMEEMEKFFEKMAFVEKFTLELADEDISYEVNKEIMKRDEPQVLGMGVPEKESDANINNAIKQSMISVQLAKLDTLLDLVGELVISEAMVIQNPDLAHLSGLNSFYKAARQHRKLIVELQDVVMSIRMVPLKGTFQKMNRIVRDMSKKLGKQVELEIRGEEIEVDKNIIEHLSDPLMHLIRNALDHGIETAEERNERGKRQGGKIVLEAKNEGGDVWISIKDDGRGLNRKQILRRASEHGLVPGVESELSDQEVYSFILLPGFSTKLEVTEFSGRGVGLDVVNRNIEEIGGAVFIDSTIDEGTTVSLKIPLTLAIIDGMGIRVGKAIYTVPITSIKESFKARAQEVFCDPDGHEMIMVRGECYPILRLHERYGINTDIYEIQDGIIMIVETDQSCICLFADELLGEQQVVVKPLPRYLKRVKGIGGCTLLGDGRTSLILDVAGLFN
ncbi:MAG: chemotaxis protein CheA [Bacillota bacterium]|nr:chemotaxis protein CheA [Bacillota bacterium]